MHDHLLNTKLDVKAGAKVFEEAKAGAKGVKSRGQRVQRLGAKGTKAGEQRVQRLKVTEAAKGAKAKGVRGQSMQWLGAKGAKDGGKGLQGGLAPLGSLPLPP